MTIAKFIKGAVVIIVWKSMCLSEALYPFYSMNDKSSARYVVLIAIEIEQIFVINYTA